MKKLFLIVLLTVVGASAFAQKSYVNVVARDVDDSKNHDVFLSGDIPSDMKNKYKTTVGEVLNLLAERGFEVEQMSCSSYSAGVISLHEVVILSKDATIKNDAKEDKELEKKE